MKKVLIISYFYEPSNFVGGQRTEFWANALHRFGYYPIIVTRNWNPKQTNLTEVVSDNALKVEKFDTHEVHRLPFKNSLRDRLDQQSKFRFLQKGLTLWELIFSNFSNSALPFSNFYAYCDAIISKENIAAVIASGRPFQSFQIGHKLRKKHDVLWIPDYRDEWNSHYRSEVKGPLMKLVTALERRSEKKWTSNADHFLSVGKLWVDRIAQFTGKPGSVVKNGYENVYPKIARKDADINVLYGGTLYPYQDISMVLDALLAIDNPHLKFYFAGVFMDSGSKTYFIELQQKFPERVHVYEKLPKSEYKAFIRKMDIGILSSYKNTDGWLPVKVFDYYANGLELLLCPTDNDLMSEFIEKTQSGAVVNTSDACQVYFKEQLQLKQSNAVLPERNYKLGAEYSRIYQTEQLAKLLDSLL